MFGGGAQGMGVRVVLRDLGGKVWGWVERLGAWGYVSEVWECWMRVHASGFREKVRLL